jgi:3',5'-cyclic AMP phosphodiesterase CpdA
MADISDTEAGYDTLWMAREATGVSKYSKVGGTWVLNNTLATPASAYHLDGLRSGSKTVVLYVVVGSGDDASRIVTLTDGSGYNANMSGTFADFALDGAYQCFRGVAVVPAAASAPWLEIADPSGATLTVPYATATYTVTGTSGNLAGTMTWTNALTAAAGSFAAAAEWSVPGIALDIGANAITVAGTNASGTAVSAAVTIDREADLVPAVTITAPAATAVRVGYDTATFAITGTTANVVGTMTWSNALNAASGSFPASATWDMTLALDVGINAFTFTGTNVNGSAASDTIDVRRLPEQVLAAGDLAFAGFNSARDAFAIVALTEIPALTTIWFTDEEWNGSGFVSPTGEADLEWNTGAAGISVGTVVTFDYIDDDTAWTVSHGVILPTEEMSLSQSGEDIYAYLGDARDPTTFLAAISTVSGTGFNIDNTGLVLGQTAIQLAQTPTALEYNGTRDGQSAFAGYLPLVNDVAQWGTPTAPLPFDTTAFVLGSAAPALAVTTAGDTVPYATTDAAIEGTFANLVGAIVWSNELSDATGTATADAGIWSATVPLAVGANLIVVSGTNTEGTPASDSVTITREDAPAASVTITTPVGETIVVPYATETYEAIEGSAVNAVGTMVLSNSLGGSDEQPAGAAWTFEEVPLVVGVNEITITVSNVAGAVAMDKLTIIRQAEAATDTLRIAAFTDPHYFATSLLINDGPAFQTYLAYDRKLIAESAAITKSVVDQIIARNANCVFVSGDLTKDGELASHMAFSNELARLAAAGAQVLVIPGNHDINRPDAVAYDGADTIPVPSVSVEEFRAIYAPFGFAGALATDPNSLSYVFDLGADVRVVAMDACQYDGVASRTAGSFPQDRLDWITNQLAVAKAQDKLVLGMMHHGLMEHFPGQKQLFSEYVLDGYQTVAPLFASLGMKAVFTGHFHANDIVQGTFDGRTIYDIETGSTVTYPCPYRVMELDGDRQLAVTTHHVASINYDLGAAPDFPTYAQDYLNSGMLLLSQGMLMAPPYNLNAQTAAYVAPAVTEALLHHYAGDEPGFAGASPQTQGIVATLLGGDPMALMLGQAIYSILTDTPVLADNNTTLDLDQSPTVSLTAPVDGAEYVLDQPVTLAASASDDRAVTNVSFRVDGTTVADDATAPYTASWTPTAPGSYILTAVAYDNAGQSTVSAVVTVETPPLSILTPVDGSSVSSATDEVTVSFVSVDLVGNVTFHNAATGETVTVPAGTTSADMGLVYGINVIVVSGNDGSGDVSDTITITRQAPTPANGGDILPEWDYLVDNGTVHIAWTTNDWYQFQGTNVCLPGTFLYRDLAGGTLEPGAGDPEALTAGATHFRYDALDCARYIVVEDDADFRVQVPCYNAGTLSAPRTNDVWMQITYWDAPGNPEWVQDWQLDVTPESGSASAPILMGRLHSADGLITEAYAFTLVGDDAGFEVAFAADPALSAANQGFVSAVMIDTRVRVPLAITGPAADTQVSSDTYSATVAVNAAGLVGSLTFRNTSTGQEVVGTGSAELTLAYGDNLIVVTGTDGAGNTVTATVTVTREAPEPLNGTDVLPNWDAANGTGTVHIAWTTNDWYQFQSVGTCLPGTFRFLDPFGGTLTEPGDGDAQATTEGETEFRYDALDATRCIVIEADDDFAVRLPCYDSSVAGVALTQEVWLQVSYWDAPGNPGWVQGWDLAATAAGGSATAPVLMGRTFADGQITEAYAFTVSGDPSAFSVAFNADPALSFLNPAYVTAITVDCRMHAPLMIAEDLDGALLPASSGSINLPIRTEGLVGDITFRNATTGQQVVMPAGTTQAALPLAYGANVLVATGTDGAGNTVTATVTVTREAPLPANGTAVLPNWDTANGTGTVHAAWTTNDWYQFQRDDTCLPGVFRFRDPFGGTLTEPGDGDAQATTEGETDFRYDAEDQTRCIVIEADDDFSARVPCFASALTGLPMNQSVWMQITYWDAPSNPGWVQGWQLTVTPEGPEDVAATEPVLMGRVHGEDGLITEAYAFTVTGDATAFAVTLVGDPALSLANAAYVSEVLVDVRSDPAVAAHRIVTTVAGSGTVSRGNILLAHGGSTNVVIAAADWHRIHSLTTNGAAVDAAIGAASFTQEFANVTEDYANHVAFGYRADAINADGVPTSWLADFGKGEAEPLVSSDRSIGEKYALDIDPYAVHTVHFGIEAFRVEGGLADMTVKLLVDGVGHEHINGTLQLDGRTALDADWAPVGGTPVTGSVFSNGAYNYYQIETDTNRFFRAVVR